MTILKQAGSGTKNHVIPRQLLLADESNEARQNYYKHENEKLAGDQKVLFKVVKPLLMYH